MTDQDAATWITAYAEAGIASFPLHGVRDGRCTCGHECASPAKHPLLGLAHRKGDPLRQTCRGECGLLGHGLYDATTEPGQLAEWLGRYPGHNWGIRPPVGTLVLDIDPRNGGDDELAALEAQHGKLPATLTARTGSGGLHLWLSYLGPTRGKLCRGVDVKTNLGYVVAPPSLHITGGTYEWIDQSPAAYAPAWVKAIMNPPVRLRPPGQRVSSGKGLVEYVATKPYGEINDAVYWAACRADEAGVLNDLLEQLVAAARHAAGGHATAAGEGQTRRTIESARRRPPDSHRHADRIPTPAEFMRRFPRKQNA